MRVFRQITILVGVVLLLIAADGCDPGNGTWRVDAAAIAPVLPEAIQ